MAESNGSEISPELVEKAQSCKSVEELLALPPYPAPEWRTPPSHPKPE